MTTGRLNHKTRVPITKMSFSGMGASNRYDDDGEFTAEQIAEFREVFNWFDKNKDGYINEIELGNAMRALGQNPTQSELNEILLSIQTSMNLLHSSNSSSSSSSRKRNNATVHNSNTNTNNNSKNNNNNRNNNRTRIANPSISVSTAFPMLSDTDEYVGRIAKYKIDFSLFLLMMAHKMQNPDDQKEIRESFKLFDVDGKGIIDKARLIHAMISVGEPLTKKEVTELLSKIDTNNDGKIDYEEFMAFMLQNELSI